MDNRYTNLTMKRNKYNLCLNITHCYCNMPKITGKRKDLFRFWRLCLQPAPRLCDLYWGGTSWLEHIVEEASLLHGQERKRGKGRGWDPIVPFGTCSSDKSSYTDSLSKIRSPPSSATSWALSLTLGLFRDIPTTWPLVLKRSHTSLQTPPPLLYIFMFLNETEHHTKYIIVFPVFLISICSEHLSTPTYIIACYFVGPLNIYVGIWKILPYVPFSALRDRDSRKYTWTLHLRFAFRHCKVSSQTIPGSQPQTLPTLSSGWDLSPST